MTAGWLKAMAARRAGLESLALMLLALAVLLLAPRQGLEARMPASVRYIDADIGLDAAAAPETGSPIGYRAIGRPVSAGWLVWDAVPISPDGPPPAISTSGPFSATLWFNGVRIGQKGEPASTAADEQAGPIDSLFSVPTALIRPEGNQLVMRLSSHRAGYTPSSVVQSLFVTPYSADTRRPVRYYLPLAVFGVSLVALAVGFGLRARRIGDGRGLRLSLALAGLTLAGAAEFSRALINYPYDWHQPRQAISLIGLAVFGLAMLRFSQLRWPASPRLAQAWLAISAALALIGAFLVTGYDGKSAAVTACLTSSLSVWIGWRGRGAARVLAFGFAALPLYALWLPADLIDRGIYVLVVGLLALPAIRFPALLQPVPEAPAATLALQATGRLTRIAHADISHLVAAGNYTEVHTTRGVHHLDNRNLSALLGLLPKQFVRIHRSHAVNLDEAETLTNAPGSKYELLLSSGARIPVSRSEVDGLRERLAGRTT
ncbi:LytTR family transcriptional regulator DNA-binding domain-containing protein [Maricaulis sp.]|uniref:LytTR family DNA-binding domain-containing protein n=1 Tax=Maricaulis sp. TaxID=1486257 RepID=UPI0025BC7C85|nr:LytTR family transcriptional regulator DNA-binding domain-containing protein [Maricaulis sp.]